MSTPRKTHADLVLKNAAIWTVDEKLPRAEAAAIKGNEIIAVGSDNDIDSFIGPETRVYNLDGKLVLPGFNDCHYHLMRYTIMSETMFDLYGADSLQEIQRRLKENALAHPDSEWLYGLRWFPPNEWPTRHDLDVVEDKRPVIIYDIDYHTAWVNTPALKRIGYDANTPEPEGGTILRDGGGYPTGVLFENAHDPVPYPARGSDEELERLLSKQIEGFNQLGITSMGNMEVVPENIEFTARLAEAGQMNLRINHWPMLVDGLENANWARERCKTSERVNVVGLKVFMDGVFSNHSAWILEPYNDAPDNIGYPVIDLEEYQEKVVAADKEGFQIITHSIGDRAVREALNIYEQAARVNGEQDRRHRIEHNELVHPSDVGRFAELNVIASMTPAHYCSPQPEDYNQARFEEKRRKLVCAWRPFVDAGAHLVFGTDWPCVDLEKPDPLQQIFAAVTRIPPQAKNGKPLPYTEHCISVEQAIRSYTLEGAYAEYMDERKGTITPGKLADLCVLNQNILDIEPHQILETKVVMTVFDGQVVFDEH
jgi:predicted amidohydrolase YtcJ